MPYRVLLTTLLGAALCAALAGCGGEDAGKMEDPAPRETITRAECPVSGTVFTPGEGVLALHDGKQYELCSHGCAIRFESDPESFIGGDK